ncbi:NERD domain-containing protein [Pseudomonas putida]|uniref:nuclease-related domain-containing protein n=1 Tax=Pseudomonas putida TaxID=303 RepID=UPI002363FABE|nr:NERD domain-containing protein [Pseudomonas putida]MDD2139545.1 NERD domain-containing protein [Pseudomonas putida]HDS1721468.1 NERD domain-containing protein [Pseudomonas putida]
MDFSLVLAQVWGAWGWLIPVVFLIGLLKSRWGKGQIGELLVRLFAHWQLDKAVYRRLHNVTLDTPDGTTQIDHVFLSPFGIFVLETKNMSGWIFGGEKQAQWTQKIYKQTYKFQNPLRQNYKHLKALESCLGVSPETLHSVITFVGGSTFKTEVPACVTRGNGFVHYIKTFQQTVFSEAEVEAMLQTLKSGRRAPTLATHREHVQNLKLRSDPTAVRQCPKCGGSLIIRTVKSGPKAGQKFWGCSGFPRCRFMQSL